MDLEKQYHYYTKITMNNYRYRNKSPYKHTHIDSEEEQPTFSTAELLVKRMQRDKEQEQLRSWIERRTMHEQMREARERFVSSLHEDNRRLQAKIVTIRSRMDGILNDLLVLRDDIVQEQEDSMVVGENVQPRRRIAPPYFTETNMNEPMNKYRRSGC